MSLSFVLVGASSIGAQETASANWKQASQFSPTFLRQYVFSTNLTPNFINKTDEFWYSWKDSKGVKFWRVNPKSKRKEPLFDSTRMAALLSETLKKPYDVTNLPITTLAFDEKNNELFRFVVDGIELSYNTKKEELTNLGRAKSQPRVEVPTENRAYLGRTGGGITPPVTQFKTYSPDKSAYLYAQDHNLFYVAVVDGKEQPPVQLSKDGEKDYSFGSFSPPVTGQVTVRRDEELRDDEKRDQQTQSGDTKATVSTPAGTRLRASATWSKDSKRFFITRSDSRKVKELWLVNSLALPRPTLLTYKYSMPGEAEVTQQEVFSFDPAKKELIKLDLGKWKDQRVLDMHFQDGKSDEIRFVRRDRLQRNLELCDVDLNTRTVKIHLSESVENAYLEVQQIRYVKPGGDFVWWSERSGWGHFYLYSNDGKLKNAITSGAFRANNLVDVDHEKGKLWFNSNGREETENPYYKHLYRVSLDGRDLTLLDGGEADHNSVLSPSKSFAIDISSRTDMAPSAVVRDEDGKTILNLEQTDLTRLIETGWKMPRLFVVKAADGVTDIYGNMYLPFDFNPKKSYPIIANVYPGPQTESVTTAFSATAGNQRLAQLGFVVIQIGNRGGHPARSNAYHSYGYYNLRDYGLADKKAGIEQLAARYPFIDIDRVGIYGHSGGGFMTAAALLLPEYNEFFKVGVSSAGNHDNNVYNQNWSEQHHGLKEVPNTPPPPTATGSTSQRGSGNPDEDLSFFFDDSNISGQVGGTQGGQTQTGTTAGTRFDIKVPTNAELAANLKGHLFLVHGDMDNNVHPAGTVRLVNALVKANKRFDMLMLPGKAHGFDDMQPYFLQRMYEYFVQHLMGAPIPSNVDMVIRP